MTTTKSHDLDTAREAARFSADEAFDMLANTEPERSRQADGLEDAIDGGIFSNEMDWLEDELGRDRTEEEEAAYVEAWKDRIRERRENEGLA
jgi:hypothetical protein